MIINSINYWRDSLHAQFCYQLFITPIHLPLEKKYRHFAKLACEFIEEQRNDAIHIEFPRHHVLHHFAPDSHHKNLGKKILITHGWLSRAAYMVKWIKVLREQGYDVYALDFPAHGESRGLQLPWCDAVTILKNILNEYGPFYGVIGHSFGGSMLLNTLNLAGQHKDWELNARPERAILIASPTRMRNPVNNLARRFKLSKPGYLHFKQLITEQTSIDVNLIRLRHFVTQLPETPFLCIHGEQDTTVDPRESILFCKQYKNANLCLLPESDHVSVLMDKRVENRICDFLN